MNGQNCVADTPKGLMVDSAVILKSRNSQIYIVISIDIISLRATNYWLEFKQNYWMENKCYFCKGINTPNYYPVQESLTKIFPFSTFNK